LCSHLYYAWFFCFGKRYNGTKIKVMRENDVIVLFCPVN
jgi:hypothetical protein